MSPTPTLEPGAHKCEIPGCPLIIGPEHAMCQHHWWIVPVKQRQSLQRAAAACRRSGDPDSLREWRDLLDDCVHTVVAILGARGEREDASLSL